MPLENFSFSFIDKMWYLKYSIYTNGTGKDSLAFSFSFLFQKAYFFLFFIYIEQCASNVLLPGKEYIIGKKGNREKRRFCQLLDNK